jgi:hypothetical protein
VEDHQTKESTNDATCNADLNLVPCPHRAISTVAQTFADLRNDILSSFYLFPSRLTGEQIDLSMMVCASLEQRQCR